jgi:MraZ protein
MPQMHGEYDCKLDSKGRIRMPSTLLRQLGGSGPHTFFVNRGFEKCLMIYPEKVWENTLERINELNVYRTQDRNFIRYFFRGVSDVTTDSADRVLLNKGLLDYAGIKKDVVLFAYLDRIELWDKQTYSDWLNREPEDFANLAEQVLGKIDLTSGGE